MPKKNDDVCLRCGGPRQSHLSGGEGCLCHYSAPIRCIVGRHSLKQFRLRIPYPSKWYDDKAWTMVMGNA